MSDRFQPLPMEQLVGWIFDELERSESIFGIPRALFFVPGPRDPFRTAVYGQPLDTPFGVAAGPHTQLAQNIVAAWLCGARFIELKTVQTLDELTIAKPCIDMRDEGYNVEWSQELRVPESLEEYLRAWALVHALHRHLGLPGERPGVVFNMSVGYDLAGVKQPNVEAFLRGMAAAGERLEALLDVISRRCPSARGLHLPPRVSDNVTVSTMHGCPPGEIGAICRHLMEAWGLHTAVKLNPTLLGPERVRAILHDALGYLHVDVPDEAFEHDIRYGDALALLEELLAAARGAGVAFGVKLCNTLEVRNHGVFAADQAMMYMSGRPHHALAVSVAHRLAEDLGGRLEMSFAGGADAWNVVDLLASGMRTVTSCSDLLRPGGYGRLGQYVEETREAMARLGAEDLDGLAVAVARRAGRPAESPALAARRNLAARAQAVLVDPLLARETFERSRTKTARALGPFDCIEAPCVDECPISQRVPEYMDLVAKDRPELAAEVIRDDNVMGAILGRACTHACELVCTRAHYDEPVAIREVKRYAMDHEDRATAEPPEGPAGEKVAVVGAGPCGLSIAWFLGRAGYRVTLFEARPYAGGMVSGSIPAYRATEAAIDQDLRLLDVLGVELRTGVRVGEEVSLESLRESHGAVVLAAGAQRGLALGIPGEEAGGVHDGLALLRAVREGRAPELGRRVGVIGGGDVAMDCARTARRLGAEVRVVYRRSRAEMPAQAEEQRDLDAEGIAVDELLAPRRVLVVEGRMAGLECERMRLGEPDGSGRRRPLGTGETVRLDLDALVVAIGQAPDLSFLGGAEVARSPSGYVAVDAETLETSIPGLYAGGDLVDAGPETIVKALADGKRIARSIRRRFEGEPAPLPRSWPEADLASLLAARARRVRRVPVPHLPADARGGFEEVVATLDDEAARAEASRCLRCDLLCSVCAGVCPNRAIQTYEVEPFEANLPLLAREGGAVRAAGSRPFGLGQRYQVAVVADLCNECGTCAVFCPTAGRPYRDKPRLYLTRAELEAEEENAFMLSREGAALVVEARVGGETHRLVVAEGELRYTSPSVEARLVAASYELLEAKSGPARSEPLLDPRLFALAAGRGFGPAEV